MNNSPILCSTNMKKAYNVLFDVVELLDSNNIVYHLEGGTLLGLVRDNSLLPWDHDVDISIPSEELPKFLKVYKELNRKYYRVSFRKHTDDCSVFEKDTHRIFKVKKMIPSILKEFIPYFKKKNIVLDVFVKSRDEKYAYWKAMGRTMRVPKKHYDSYEEIDFDGRKLKVPNYYEDYLTEKYGDWSVPVKNWVCGENELTICD